MRRFVFEFGLTTLCDQPGRLREVAVGLASQDRLERTLQLTADPKHVRTYFPEVELVAP